MAGAPGRSFSPAQIQKLMFLVDENLAAHVGGKQFDFKPYDYGPFDHRVYRELEQLEMQGTVAIARSGDGRWRTYSLTAKGMERGQSALEDLREDAAEYLRQIAEWVVGQRFQDLVAAIYQRYPAMKVNSVFRD